jgi:hypothetical protein
MRKFSDDLGAFASPLMRKLLALKNDAVERYGYRVVFVVIIGATAMLIALCTY